MIDYSTYCRIHSMKNKEGLKISQIAGELKLDETTVSRWLKKPTYTVRKQGTRGSLLDPYKESITRMLQYHCYSAMQIFQRITENGYEGGYTTVKIFVRKIRPPRHKAYLSLSFDPGDCAQVDWGYAGMIDVGSTRRRLSFFVMVMCYSRMMYVEFTLSETQEQFLACHEHAFEYFGRCPRRVMIDNLKSAVLSHQRGHQAVYHPRFVIGAINPAVKIWLDEVANVRKHAVTRKRPVDMFKDERSLLHPLTSVPYDVGISHNVTANSQYRVIFKTNRAHPQDRRPERNLRQRSSRTRH